VKFPVERNSFGERNDMFSMHDKSSYSVLRGGIHRSISRVQLSNWKHNTYWWLQYCVIEEPPSPNSWQVMCLLSSKACPASVTEITDSCNGAFSCFSWKFICFELIWGSGSVNTIHAIFWSCACKIFCFRESQCLLLHWMYLECQLV